MSAARPGQPGAAAATGLQQQPSVQGQGMGMGQGQAKPGQMGPTGGPMGQARLTGPTGTTPVTIVSHTNSSFYFSSLYCCHLLSIVVFPEMRAGPSPLSSLGLFKFGSVSIALRDTVINTDRAEHRKEARHSRHWLQKSIPPCICS